MKQNRHLNTVFKFISFLVSIIGISILASCGDNSGIGDDSDFDREVLLESLGNNIIIPSYKDYQQSIIDFRQRTAEFTLVPNSQTLQILRDQFRESYLEWQNCSFYEFGPAKDVRLKASTNTFPTNSQKIETNIESGTYDLSAPSNFASAGFPAIDYLIYGEDLTDNEIIIKYVDEPARAKYLNDLLDQMKSTIDEVVDGWIPNGENYIEKFVALSGKESNSSLSMLLNEYNRHYEINTIEGKIGLPLGIRPPGLPGSNLVEAYYSNQSLPYAIENVRALRDLFLGNYDGNTGLGFDDWLNAIGATSESVLLSFTIESQFDTTLSVISRIPDPFSEIVTDPPSNVNDALVQMEVLEDLLKVQMPSAIGITINFDQSN